MDQNNKNNPSPEAELDALLAQFLADPTDEIPTNVGTDHSPITDTAPVDSSWMDSILAPPEMPTTKLPEIGPDEQAMAAAGLTHPKDAQLEQILAESRLESPALELPPEEPEPFLDEEIRDAFDEGKTLDEIFATEDTLAPMPEDLAELEEEIEEDPPYEEDAPTEKRMPKKKNTYGLFGLPHLFATVIWLAIAVFIGATLGRTLWYCAADVLAFGREDKSVTLTITDQDDLDSITQKLHATGLVEYPDLFKLYAQLSNAMNKISSGTYKLNTLYDYHALVLMMSPSGSNRVTVDVMIPEGYTCAQIFQLLQEKGVCTVAELEEAAANGELAEYWFLEGVERGSKYCLEGYLFPDTYEFYMDDTPTRVLNKLLQNFDNRFTDNMAAKLEQLNITLAKRMAANGLSQEYIDSHQYTIREVVIIASMIEKETAAVSESYTISSVIYNRLTDPDEPYLNIDAALVYITGNKQLTEEDKQLDSPYNTYLYKGLIPGPISNPGRSSLDAALDPEESAYYYYAMDPATNRHHFSKTYKEHLAFLDSLKKE